MDAEDSTLPITDSQSWLAAQNLPHGDGVVTQNYQVEQSDDATGPDFYVSLPSQVIARAKMLELAYEMPDDTNYVLDGETFTTGGTPVPYR